MDVSPLKMLFIHCDYFSYLTTQPTKIAEKIANGCKSCAFKNVLVIFVTVEKCDEKNRDIVVKKCAEETINKAKQLGVKNLVLYPFVHLSDETSDPNIAMKIMEDFREKLMSLGYIADRAPFGWEKVFSLTSKGHPLAESSRTIRL
jgi:threonyl-tRNA synthetase